MTKRRFTASSQTISRDFYRLMTDIQATSLKINQDVMKGDAEVVFDRSGTRYVLRCDKWQESNDNLRAIYHTIRYLHKAIAEYGVTSEEIAFDDIFQRIFGGFIATPDDSVLMLSDGSKPWFEVLGVRPDAGREAIRNAYRALSKIHHPDNGGSADDFRRLRIAYEQGNEITSKRNGKRN